MNIAHQTMKADLRQTVVGLFYCISGNKVPLIGIHWPAKAAQAAEANLSLVSGLWGESESLEIAMRHHISAEYGYDEKSVMEITPLNHQEFFSDINKKRYHWCLVQLKRHPGVHVSQPKPAVSDVASFGWYGPNNLISAIELMHSEKQFMFKQVLRLAIDVEPVLLPYRKNFY